MAKRRTRAESRARYYIRDEAKKRGWNIGHVAAGGEFLEENEILAHFRDIGLGLERPDFLVCLGGEPCMVIEAKNEQGKLADAVEEAIGYADAINATKKYKIRLAIGAAGEEDVGFMVEVRYLSRRGWVPLISRGQEITTVPSKREVELAIAANDGTTEVSVPDSSEFIDAAVELSILLRAAKVEAPLRPKVIGAVLVAMYEGDIDATPKEALSSINELVATAIRSARDISSDKREKLIDALHLSGADFERLAPFIRRVVAILRRLNVRSVLQTDTDFLGMFYEAFLRYGYDNNALGIVFTPRHITRYCAELTEVRPTDRVIDVASGTGGFLVAAFDRMMKAARSNETREQIKKSLNGFDTNPTVWALANLNMFFRGDGKSHIQLGNCFEKEHRTKVKRKFTKAFLNPPFSQDEEPEVDFINASMEALAPEGILAAVVYAGVFADEDHATWRTEFLRKHALLGMISLPEELFYPTAAPTSIMIARAHVPQGDRDPVFMGRIWNDGYEKLKNRRVERSGSQLDEVQAAFQRVRGGRAAGSALGTKVNGKEIKSGAEWSPQQWLPQPRATQADLIREQELAIRSIYQAVSQMPELADQALANFTAPWSRLPPLPVGQTGPITDFFQVGGGQSRGEKNYAEGETPYVSSGETSNSIIRLVSPVADEVFENGALTVTAFGNACVQPWPFMARGNGGSAVRVLRPKYNMSFRELIWFAAQINLQKWRFFYARMSIKSRLERLTVASPPARMPDAAAATIACNVLRFRDSLQSYSRIAAE